MRRLAAAAMVACLLVPLFVMPVGADSATITTDITVGAGHTTPNGAWGFSDGCETGIASGQEYRCAFEFNIASLSSTNARVSAATLSIRRSGGCATNDCPVGIYSYAGNGSADLGDVLSGSSITTWIPSTTSTHSWNVLGLIQAHVDNNEQWAGFRLSAASGNSAVQDFDISSGSRVSLAVTYVPLPVDITVSAAGDGTGNITSNPSGIDCGSTCAGVFTYSAPLTLTADPTNGSQFVSWSGIECDGGNQSTTCSFNVPSVPQPIVATFSGIGPPITPPPNPTPHPSGPILTPKPTAKPSSGPGTPTQVPATQGAAATQVPGSAGPVSTDAGPIATFAPGETVGPTLGATQPTSDEGGGVPLGPIILIVGIVLAIGVGAGAYMYARRRQGMAPPGA